MDPRSFRRALNLPPGSYRLGGRFTPGVKALIWLFGLTCFLFNLGRLPALRSVMEITLQQLVLQPALALGMKPWQLLTGPLLQLDPIGYLFTVLLLWSMGSAVEQQIGTRAFLRLCALSSLAAALVAAGVGRLWPGKGEVPVLFEAGPVFLGLLGAFGRLFAKEKVTMFGVGQPVSAWSMTLFFMGLSAAMYLLRTPPHWVELSGACAAAAVGLSIGRGGAPRPWLELRRLIKDAQLRWHRRKYKVMDGGLAQPGRGPGPSAGPTGGRPSPDRRWVN